MIKKCFYPPHCTWLKNSLSDFEADAAQTVSSSVSDCGTTISSPSSFSPPHWSSSAAVWLLTITLHIFALFLMLAHYHECTITCQHMRASSFISLGWHALRDLWRHGGRALHNGWPSQRGEHDNVGHQTARKVRGMQLLFQSFRETFSRNWLLWVPPYCKNSFYTYIILCMCCHENSNNSCNL